MLPRLRIAIIRPWKHLFGGAYRALPRETSSVYECIYSSIKNVLSISPISIPAF